MVFRGWGLCESSFHGLGFRAFNLLLVPKETAPGLSGQLVQMWDREVRQSGGTSSLSISKHQKSESDTSLESQFDL